MIRIKGIVFIFSFLILTSWEVSHAQDKTSELSLAEDTQDAELQLNYKEPVTIQLNQAVLKQIFSTFSQLGKVNILFDETVQLNKIVPGFSVKNLPFNKALSLLLKTNNLAGVQIDEETVVIVTAGKYQQYAKSVKKLYRLSYIEANKLVSIIQLIFGTQSGEPGKIPVKLIVEDSRNLLIALGTKEIIEEIDSLIKDIDCKLPQAIIELKIVEASKEKKREYGVELSEYQISSTKLIPQENFLRVTANDFPALIKYLQTNSEVKVLASPNIRVVNKQKATISIADQIPVQISTTQISTPTTGGGAVPTAFTTTQVQFFDIGIKFNVTPTIHLDNEITMDLIAEISSLGKTTTAGIPEIGKRTAQTIIRLKDGETAIMGGLKKEEERESIRGLPFLSDIPLIGVLFRSTTTQIVESEIILSITPHIIPINSTKGD